MLIPHFGYPAAAVVVVLLLDLLCNPGMAGVNTIQGPFLKLARSLRERGLKGTVLQLYTIGDLRFGELKGKGKRTPNGMGWTRRFE